MAATFATINRRSFRLLPTARARRSRANFACLGQTKRDFLLVRMILPNLSLLILSSNGFLVHFDSDGRIHQSTFFGGSGSDRIMNVAGASPLQASLAGRTTSADLPLQNPEQPLLRGSSDGFAAVIGTKLIGVSHVTGAKGLRAYAPLFLPATTGVITATTSDPVSVLLADTLSAPASPSITMTAAQSAYYVECQVDATSVDVTFTAPGFPSSTAHVDCVRPTILVSASASLARGDGPGTYRTGLWSSPAQASASLYAINPNNPNDSNRLFAGSDADRIPVVVQVSNPAVLKTSSSTLLLGGSSQESLSVVPSNMGMSDVVFACVDVDAAVPAAVNFVVTEPFVMPASLSIFGGFQLPYRQASPARGAASR